MLDFLERLEILAEISYYEILQPDGKLKCECGIIFDADKEGGCISPNPYSMPVCGKCLEKFINSKNYRKKGWLTNEYLYI